MSYASRLRNVNRIGLSSLTGGSSSVFVEPDDNTVNSVINILAIGASITHGTFDQEELIEQMFADQGLYVKVVDRAVGGSKSGTALSTLPSNMAEVSNRPGANLMSLHTNGNNLTSAYLGYPQDAEEMESNFRAIIEAGLAAGFDVIPSPISYRVPPASMPAEEYNSNHIIPAIQELTPKWLGVYDLHTWTYDNQSYLTDGIHPDDVGDVAMAQYFVDSVAPKLNQSIPETEYIEDVLIRFCSDSYHSSFMGLKRNQISNALTPIDIYNINGSKVTGGSASIDGGYFLGKNGYGGSTNIELSIHNNALNKENCSVTETTPINIIGLDPNATYKVQITGSRTTDAATRVGKYTIGLVTQLMNCALGLLVDGLPSVIEFTGVTHDQLMSFEPDIGSTHAYVNGMRITKE